MFHGKTVISPYWFRRTEARSSSSLFHLFRIHNTSVREQTDLFVALRIGILIFFTRFNCRKEGFLTCSGPFRDVWKFISFEEISKCDASHVYSRLLSFGFIIFCLSSLGYPFGILTMERTKEIVSLRFATYFPHLVYHFVNSVSRKFIGTAFSLLSWKK